jgi:hypothetical protein
MLDQSFDLFRRCGTLQGYGKCDVFECRTRPFQAEFGRDVKSATDIDLSLLDRNFVEMREPRDLGQESKRSAHEKIREWGPGRDWFRRAAPAHRFPSEIL